ncbi:MAG: ribbon-helix-helix domain-containing protein [Candidatus Hermodarchaeota archaeon]
MSDFLGLISTKSLNISRSYIFVLNKTKIIKVIFIKLISVNLPESYLKVLEILVAEGKFPNRSEAIRVSIRDLIKTEYLIEESIERNVRPTIIESEIANKVEEKLFI